MIRRPVFLRKVAGAGRSALAALLVLAVLVPAGCDQGPRDRHAYALDIPPAWKPWSRAEPTVPGDLLEAYEVPAPEPPPGGTRAPPPGGTHALTGSLVVFRSPHAPETTAAQLLTATHFLLYNLPSLRIESGREAIVGGAPAIVMEVVAAGSGDALYPTGLGKPLPPPGAAGPQVPTRRIWVRIPRGQTHGVLEIFFHAPDSVEKELRPAWEAVLASVKLGP